MEVTVMADNVQKPKRDSNLNIRVTPQQKLVITRAAEIKQTTVSNFVLEQAMEAARKIVHEQRQFSMSADQWKIFCEALEAKPREYTRLKKLMEERSVFEKE